MVDYDKSNEKSIKSIEEECDRTIATLHEEIYSYCRVLNLITFSDINEKEISEFICNLANHDDFSDYTLSETMFNETDFKKSLNTTYKTFIKEKRERLKNAFLCDEKLKRYNDYIKVTLQSIRQLCYHLMQSFPNDDNPLGLKNSLSIESLKLVGLSDQNKDIEPSNDDLAKTWFKPLMNKTHFERDIKQCRNFVSTPNAEKTLNVKQSKAQNYNIQTTDNFMQLNEKSGDSYEICDISIDKTRNEKDGDRIPQKESEEYSKSSSSHSYAEHTTNTKSKLLPRPNIQEITPKTEHTHLQRKKSSFRVLQRKDTRHKTSKKSVSGSIASHLKLSHRTYLLDFENTIPREQTGLSHLSYSLDQSTNPFGIDDKKVIEPIIETTTPYDNVIQSLSPSKNEEYIETLPNNPSTVRSIEGLQFRSTTKTFSNKTTRKGRSRHKSSIRPYISRKEKNEIVKSFKKIKYLTKPRSSSTLPKKPKIQPTDYANDFEIPCSKPSKKIDGGSKQSENPHNTNRLSRKLTNLDELLAS